MNIAENNSFCDYCLNSFNSFYIRCDECINVALCIKCFSYGAQGGSHKKYHPYSIKITKFISDVFSRSSWNSEDELKLLNTIELYGVGNWVDVADKVETYGPEQCREHYIKYYINGAIGHFLRGTTSESVKSEVGVRKCKVRDHSVNYYEENIEHPKLSPSLFEVLPPCSLSEDDQVILGYMPKRDDFERDYDNDAESILCRLKPDFSKDELLDALKVAHVGIYTQRLKERQRRKMIAREHDLISPIMACILNKRWKPASNNNNHNNNNINNNNENLLESKEIDSLIKYRKSCNLRKSTAAATIKSRRNSIALSPLSAKKGLSINDDAVRNKPYDAFLISDHMKPFLRYLNYSQAKALLENLHKEEMMKFEIGTMIEAFRRDKRKVFDANLRYPKSSIFVNSRPKLSNNIHHTTNNINSSVNDSNCQLQATINNNNNDDLDPYNIDNEMLLSTDTLTNENVDNVNQANVTNDLVTPKYTETTLKPVLKKKRRRKHNSYNFFNKRRR